MLTMAANSQAADASSVEPAIEARGVTKAFFGALVLDRVDFSVARGEVHGLIGKNGAGKSTLLKILSGAQPPDKGEIILANRARSALNPLEARRAGIAVVYQNPELHHDLSVAANIFLGAEPRTRLRLIDDDAMVRDASALLTRLGLSLPAERTLGELDIADRQQVAIAKAVRERAKVLLLDEPTSALNKSQVDFLFRLIRGLKRDGMAVVYISHHLDEVLAISDRITVLRNGRRVGVVDARTVDRDRLIEMIVGRAVRAHPPSARSRKTVRPLLSLRSVSLPGRLNNISLEVGAGEIVGLTGLTGAGARALASAIGGIEPVIGGITLEGKAFAPPSVHEAIRSGVVYAPEDMRGRGLVMPLSVAANISLAHLASVALGWWIDLSKEKSAAAGVIRRLDIAPRDPDREVQLLSGGNQRKTLIGRAIFADARLFVLEEPTQGVDVEARRQIDDRLRELADKGAAIVFVSTDLEELIDLADRILILRGGGIDREVLPYGLTPDRLLAAIQFGENRGAAIHG